LSSIRKRWNYFLDGPCLPWNQNRIIVAGNGTTGDDDSISMLNEPWDLSIDSNFNLYISDTTNSRIIMFPSGSLVGIPLTSGSGSNLSQVVHPRGSVIDTYGNLYVADAGNYRIMKYANITSASQSPPIIGEVVVNADFGTGYDKMGNDADVAVDSLGNIFVSDSNHRVLKWAPGATNGTLVAGRGDGYWGDGADELRNPIAIYVDQNMTLYIADSDNNRIQKWISGSSEGTTVGQLYHPTDVVVDSNGTIYAWSSAKLYRFYPGSTSGTIVISSYTARSYGFKFDSVGNVYVATYWDNTIDKYTVNNASCSTYMPHYELYSAKANIYLIFLSQVVEWQQFHKCHQKLFQRQV